MAAHRIYFAAVERHVKERLVGAAVLVAAAVILIPEMLSGPKREQRHPPAAQVAEGGEPPLKTYTIDLSQSPAAKAAPPPESATPPTVIEAPAPPPENSEPSEAVGSASADAVPPNQAQPESPAVEKPPSDATSVDRSPPESAAPTPPAVAAAPSQRDVAPPATPAANPEAPVRSAEKGWAVQLASLDNQAAANSMSKQLRDKGYDAFVMPFKKGAATWYRVRVGPVKERQAANELQRKVKETTPGAIVVPHP